MAMRVWGQRWESGELSTTDLSQRIIFNNNIALKAIRTQIIVYNDPTFTDLNMKIYSDRNGSPQKLLATSTNSLTKAEIHTQANALKEIYFEFDNVSFNGFDTYHLVINGTGYSPTGAAHLAWRKGFVDPVYTLNLTSITPIDIARLPYTVAVIAHIVE